MLRLPPINPLVRKPLLMAFVLLALITTITSCEKDRLLTATDAAIVTSIDTLHFDTLFTTTGSFTQQFTIRNENDQRISISSIELAGGHASVFRINVNGEVGPVVSNVEINANDSIHVFVNATIPRGTKDLPFIVQDSIRINWNSNVQYVQLDAWGQNARFYRNAEINNYTEWNSELPYVITGMLKINENAVLKIKAGTRIYLHADAAIMVDGTLQVNGEADSVKRVIFTGDRLDEPYKNFPASWPGIYLRNKSRDNSFEYAIIKNAYQAIVAEGQQNGTTKKLTLNQCIIDNSWDAGLLAVNSSVEANNCLVSNCGKNLQLVYGGNYQFNHCTFVAISNRYIVHKDPLMFISNAIKINDVLVTNPLKAGFINTICWTEGSPVENEIIAVKEANQSYYVNFSYGTWKKPQSANITFDNMSEDDPLFVNTQTSDTGYDFHLKDNSPALNKGKLTLLTIDLDGANRNIGGPDFGAYEKQ